MQFLYPTFLFALVAIAIPIIIHLFNFRTYKTIYFSNVKFLQHVKQETKAKSQLKHLLVLLLRILAIASLVFAFTQPYIPTADVEKSVSKQEVVSIYVDNSFSMDAESKYGKLIESAKKRARDIATSYRNNTRFLLITNDFEMKHQHLLNKEQLFEYLAEINVSPKVRLLSEIFIRQQDFLEVSAEVDDLNTNDLQNSSYILSDFQKISTDFENLKNDSSLSVTLLPLATQVTNNLFIDSIWFETPGRKINQPEELYVKIVNKSPEAYSDIPVRLFINDSLKALASFHIAEQSTHELKISYTNSQIGIIRGRIEITDYPITYDNTFYFSYTIAPSINVLAINQDSISPYIRALFGNDAYIHLTNFSADNIRTSEFGNFSVIILNGLKAISSGLEQELLNFTANGGSLVLFPLIEHESKPYNKILTSMNLNTYKSVDKQKTIVETVNYQSDIYANVFKEIDDNMDLPIIFQHLTLSSLTQVNQEIILATQNNHPMLTKSVFGRGKVYTFSVPLQLDKTNFPQHPLFVPTLYNIALYSQIAKHLYYTIGKDEVAELNITQQTLSNSGDYDVFHVSSIDGKYDFIPRVYSDITAGGLKLHTQQNIRDAANYYVKLNNEVVGGFSFNYNRSESNLEYYQTIEIKEALDKYNLLNFSLIETIGDNIILGNLREINQGKTLWKQFIILTLIFLALEIILLRINF